MEPDEAPASVQGPASGSRDPRGPLRFGFLGRLHEENGLEFLLDALRICRDRHGEVAFTFAGEGPYEAAIRAFVKSHGLEKVVVKPVRDVVGAMSDMDVLVLPSLSEALAAKSGSLILLV